MPDVPPADFNLSCPAPINQYPHVTLAHGGGGRLMNQLIERMFVRAFGNDALNDRHDGARLEPADRRLAFSTKSTMAIIEKTGGVATL